MIKGGDIMKITPTQLNENIFKGKKNGIYVNLGAYDGVESSNTLFFEESLWMVRNMRRATYRCI